MGAKWSFRNRDGSPLVDLEKGFLKGQPLTWALMKRGGDTSGKAEGSAYANHEVGIQTWRWLVQLRQSYVNGSYRTRDKAEVVGVEARVGVKVRSEASGAQLWELAVHMCACAHTHLSREVG